MGETGNDGEVQLLADRVTRLEKQLEETRQELLNLQQWRQQSPESTAPPPQAQPGPMPTWNSPPAVPLLPTPHTGRPEPARAAERNLESRFGAQVLSKVGVVLLLLGTAWFLKWAFDNQWIGPLGRVLAGLLAGSGIIVWSEWFRRKGYAPFSYALKAVGSGVLYLSLWAAFQLYHLLPATVALLAMVAVTAWNAWMAWSQDAELLAGYALLGAYLTPALLSTGGDHEIFLFSYLSVIGASVLVMLRAKPWQRLLLGALPATAAYFIAWYVQHFQPEKEQLTLGFALLLWAVFAAVPLVARESESVIGGVLTPLGAGVFGGLSVYSVLADSNGKDWEPWAAITFAAVYLARLRVRRAGVASAVHLTLALVFLTAAIPLKLTGRAITVGWLAEALALLWISTVLEADRRVHAALRGLGFGSLLLGVGGALSSPLWAAAGGQAFLNRTFATEVGAALALFVAIFVGMRMRDPDDGLLAGGKIAAASILMLNIVPLVAMHREIFRWWVETAGSAEAAQSSYADFCFSGWMTLQGALALIAGFWKRSAFVRWHGLVLLTLTIIKVLAYDMRTLSTGNRVASYMVLGVVLMGVSFAYQKDWLGLRDAVSVNPASDESEGQR